MQLRSGNENTCLNYNSQCEVKYIIEKTHFLYLHFYKVTIVAKTVSKILVNFFLIFKYIKKKKIEFNPFL